jgi:hypothetical protein
MKKILVLFAILYSFQANAADLTDTIGAECSRILISLNDYVYPNNFDIMEKRNSQFNYLEKCLKLYKETGGNINILNKKYLRAYNLYEISNLVCSEEKDAKKNDSCLKMSLINFNDDIKLSSLELSNKYSLFFENIDETKKDTIIYKSAQRKKELALEWFNEDKDELEKIITQITEENKKEEQDKKGFLSWFK